MSMVDKFKAFRGDAVRPDKLKTKSWRKCVGKRNGFTDSVASRTCINSYFAGTDHWTGSIRRNSSQSLCDMFRCSLQIIISQGHHLHLEVFFHFAAISLTERIYHIHLCPRVVLTAADFSRSRGDALLFLNKVVPYLISLHVFIFCWFYNQRCTN